MRGIAAAHHPRSAPMQAGSSNASLLDVARICTDDQLAWAPEVSVHQR